MPSPIVHITVNGDPHQIAAGATVAELLEQLDAQPRRVAVEVNLQIVPRAQHADQKLDDGDRVEIVTLVGGG